MSKCSSILHSSKVRDFAKLLSANIVAQVIGLLIYPIVTRLYAPEDFGLMNLFISIANVIVIIATAEFQYAVVLPKEDKKAVSVMHVGLFCLSLVTFLVTLSIFCRKQIAMLFNTPALSDMYVLLPIMVFVLGAWNLLNYWYIRNKMYTRISTYQIGQSTLSAATKLGCGYTGLLQVGLIYSVVFAPLLSLFTSIAFSFRKCLRPLLHVDKRDMLDVAKTYRNFPVFTLPRSLLNTLAGQLPVLLLTPIFGIELIGYWSMASLLGFVPINMITKAIYQVLYQHVTEKVNHNQPIVAMLKHFVIICLMVAIPLFAILYFVLPALVSWLLGDVWYVCGEYIRWMLPWLLLSLLTASTCFLSDVFFQQKKGLFFEILLAICRLAGLVVGVIVKDFTVAIAAYSIGSAIAIAAQFVWLMTLAKKYETKLLNS